MMKSILTIDNTVYSLTLLQETLLQMYPHLKYVKVSVREIHIFCVAIYHVLESEEEPK